MTKFHPSRYFLNLEPNSSISSFSQFSQLLRSRKFKCVIREIAIPFQNQIGLFAKLRFLRNRNFAINAIFAIHFKTLAKREFMSPPVALESPFSICSAKFYKNQIWKDFYEITVSSSRISRLNTGNFRIFYPSEFYLILSGRIRSALKIIQNDTDIGHQL